MNKKQSFGKSLVVALNGIAQFVAKERNAKIQLAAAVISILFSIAFEISTTEWLFVILSIVLVFIAEIINTSIEKLCDLNTKEFSPDIKFIKDISAGAVLIAALFSVITAGVIFLPKILELLK
ncbi:MAG: diacylglycerol kinase family protein [Chitinophagaceae bacterium]|nr:diacylglycerol kinase family protein [Chitinophagaceae bacterium]